MSSGSVGGEGTRFYTNPASQKVGTWSQSTRMGKGICPEGRMCSVYNSRRNYLYTHRRPLSPRSEKGQAEKSRKAKKLTMFGRLRAYQCVGVRRGPRRRAGADGLGLRRRGGAAPWTPPRPRGGCAPWDLTFPSLEVEGSGKLVKY